MSTHSRPLLAVLVAAVASTASAQSAAFGRSFDLVPVKHSPQMKGGFALEGARLLPQGSIKAWLLLDANWGLLSLQLGKDHLGDLLPFRLDGHLLAAYQLHSRVELSLDLPVTLFQRDRFDLLETYGFPTAGVATMGPGDLRLQGRFGILSEDRFPLSLAATAEVRFPTGDGHSFLGDRAMVFAPRVSAERTFGPVRVLGNLGLRLRAPAQFLNLQVGNEVTLGAGAILALPFETRFFHQPELVAETHLVTPLEAPFNFAYADSLKTPWEIQLGVRARVLGRWGVELGFGKGVGLTGGYGRNLFRLFAALTYAYEVGSPTELDMDGDGVSDGEDRCPQEKEDRDGFQDDDGCPDPDNDQDGTPDESDQCLNQAGPPELDGCPDRDGDEVPDVVDKCPDTPGAPEKEGCPYEDPQVVLESDRIRIRGNILFETASAKIQSRSFGMLDEVYKVLNDNPEVGPVQVEGHTDNRGSRAYNLDLSQRRAKSVVDYLISKGIDAKRLRPKGFGFDRPVATNTTPVGRAKNRRVEFNLIDATGETAGSVKQVDEVTEQPAPSPADASPEPGAPSKPDAGTP